MGIPWWWPLVGLAIGLVIGWLITLPKAGE